ncbi:hypothetical protein BD779DRAFT_1670036 [Infundibulicybe gibba]|nr:hypothetical protein BD779DRAFT_1670036 [Infundibulicybe gibba]
MSESRKLLLLWTLTLFLHYSSTPPTPKLPTEKSRPVVENPSIWERVIFTKPVRIITKGGYWVVAMIETVVTIAGMAPEGTVSKFILETLFANRNPGRLRILPISSVGLGLALFGCLLRFYCFRTMGQFFTFDRKIREDHQLITSGPYGIVRHPSYSGFLFQFPGILLWYMSQGSFLKESGFLDTQLGKGIVVAWVILRLATNALLLRGMPLEDAALRKKFGKQWDAWAQQVPYWIIPGVI